MNCVKEQLKRACRRGRRNLICMKVRWLIIAVLASQFARAETGCPTCAARVDHIDIEVVPHGWDGADLSDIQAVLHSAAVQFPFRMFGFACPPIFIFYNMEYPVILREKSKHQKVQIGLNTGGNYWAQYSFQFSHELVHLLIRHMHVSQQSEATRRDGTWLEESLAEVGSLYALRSMAREWKVQAPYPNWMSFSETLREYAQDRIDKAESQLGKHESFYKWFEGQQSRLQENAFDRETNTVIAAKMLPLFEQDPETWVALLYYSRADIAASDSLSEAFTKWAKACPENLKPHVDKLAVVFSD